MPPAAETCGRCSQGYTRRSSLKLSNSHFASLLRRHERGAFLIKRAEAASQLPGAHNAVIFKCSTGKSGRDCTKDSTGEDRRHTAKGAALLPPPAPLPAARPGLLPRAPHRRASQRRAAGTGQNQRRYEPGRLQAKRAEGRKRKKKKKYNSRRRADKLLTESRMRTSRRGRLSAELGRSSFPPGCAPSAGAERRADPGAGRAPPARPLAP